MIITEKYGHILQTKNGPRINFGKHKGKPLTDVPGGYLRWIMTEMIDASKDLVFDVRAELMRRKRAEVETEADYLDGE